MSNIPSTRWPDSTLALLTEGYEFISKRCQRYNTDMFKTRLLLQKVVCMRGEEAAKIFYDNQHFKRHGAMPQRVQKTLLGQGGVQGLDGEAHRCRKDMFMSLMSPARIDLIGQLTAKHWREAQKSWQTQEKVNLFVEVNLILCRAACEWADVPLVEAQVKPFTEELVAMIEAPAALGLRHWQGRKARDHAEERLARLIEDIRSNAQPTGEQTAARTMAFHKDVNGNLLEPRIAAVELLNILRPIVAIGRFIVFSALALHEHPPYRQKLQTGDEQMLTHFVQEVRRYYPFFPTVAGIVKQAFSWQGYKFPKGRWVLLDLYGTNRDPRLWERPNEFRPERFESRDINSFNLIPQGGGDYHQHHRCAGEWVTLEVMKVALHALTQEMEYTVPPQDLSFSLSHMPAIPKSRFIISDVQAKPGNL
ncbi:cytochrome P450 [Alteromonas pelagimontana]|uniref:Cytochrome P450 n=1 Tax=Alteromonas pelagimontana TaxID=1858656 RepID=A0A6M4MDM0_9ALTE|nr:cytochrome P450 [Alteromonas pelagimontana]QJR81281.1 cytochrome P450 [Alteromonas pelagimontana]